MVADMKLGMDSVSLLLQVVFVLWDHYTLLVQEQAREMLVHLVHELVITKIDDNTTTPNKQTIETFVESIRRHDSNAVWSYEDCNGKDEDDDQNRVPASMTFMTNEVIDLFSISYPQIHEQWAKITLSWATSCSVRHIACRSFQIFRCILSSLDQMMLADMLARLSNTIADEEADIQTFSMEILTTLKTIIGALQPSDLLQYPQLFWATCACLNTIYEREFIETLAMLSKLLEKIDLSDFSVLKILKDAKPERWQGNFEGIAPLIYKGIKSATTLEKSLNILDKIILLPNDELVGDDSRILFVVLANLPCFLQLFEDESSRIQCVQFARNLATVAESHEHREIASILDAFAKSRYTDKNDFLAQILTALKTTYFPAFELRSLIFLIGLLTNRLVWYKLKILEILCALIPDIDTRRPEIASQGPDLISPLLRLLQTEYCPQALQVMDHIMIMSTTPMDKHHMRMSMASSGSRSIRKEYERTQSLYGIPEDTGWSIPMPAIHSNTTRANMQAVFFTCASANTTESSTVATPDVEFHAEEYLSSSYFSLERTDTMNISEDSNPEYSIDGGMGDLASKLDSLDDFFEDSLTSDNDASRSYSGVSMTSFNADSDSSADLYDQQTAPILHKSLARAESVTSLHNSFTDLRGPIVRDLGPMNPTAFAASSAGPPASIVPSSSRPTLHSRSITSPANNLAKPGQGVDVLSDDETDGTISEDEHVPSHGNPRTLGSSLRSIRPSLRKHATHASDLIRRQSRSKTRAPDSPDVPKVPEAYLHQYVRSADP